MQIRHPQVGSRVTGWEALVNTSIALHAMTDSLCVSLHHAGGPEGVEECPVGLQQTGAISHAFRLVRKVRTTSLMLHSLTLLSHQSLSKVCISFSMKIQLVTKLRF